MNNRELKFRVWDISHKCFIDSEKYCWGEYFEKTKYGRYGEVGKLLLDFSGNIRVALYPSGNGDNSADSVFNPLPNPLNFVIQQYIGINDKSKKEIFEGDIVHFDDSEISSKPCIGDFEVCYETDLTLVSAPSFILFNSRGAVLSMLGDIKVIGNIIENPELLK